MTSAIATRGLHKHYGDKRAVDGLELDVPAGSFFGFLGPNGAGKSTTIKMLTGLIPPTAGSARVLDYDIVVEPIDVKRRIGVVPEELALFDRLSGPEYLEFIGRMHGLNREQIRARSQELLSLMELDDDQAKLVTDYSHGMKKKLALSAALIHQPRVLFLDEPFEGIDAVASRLIRSLLARLVSSGVTIFLTSHILEIVEKLCSHVAIIHHGRLVLEGPLGELRRGQVDAAGVEAGGRSLEELFLDLVGADANQEGRLSWLD